MNKVINVQCFFSPIGKEVTRKVSTGEKKKGLFGGEKDVTKRVKEFKQTGVSDNLIDGARLANDMAQAVSELNCEGFEVVSVTPVTSGSYHSHYSENIGTSHSGGSGYGYGYGFSFTEGVTIVAKQFKE